MYYTYLTHSDGEYGFGVCSQLLNKKLPDGLCYFEVFSSEKDAKERRTCLKKLSPSKLSSLIKSKKTGGFLCQNDGKNATFL